MSRRTQNSKPEAMPEAETPPKKLARHPPLVTWKELPLWQQDNHYIFTHYRPASNSFTRSLASLFYLHNESVNIHSHLWAAVLFLILPYYVYQSFPNATDSSHLPGPSSWTRDDYTAFSFFFGGAVACLSISGFYHCLSNHSPHVAKLGNQLDYVGIVFLITGSFIPSIYYGFYCDPILQRIYWGMISTLGVGCTVVSVNSKFRTPGWRPFRAGMFVAMGLSAIVPVLHGLRTHGWAETDNHIGLTWLLLQGFLYILGAGLYAVSNSQWKSSGTQLICV
jgi:adiponectin receptor